MFNRRRKSYHKKQNFIFGVIILLILIGMGVGFSYLNANLSINGSTMVSKNTWDVHFQNLIVDSKSADASTPATIDSTGTGVRFSVNLDKPGDFYSFTVDVLNAGSIDAMVSGLTKTVLTDVQSKYLEYIVTYSDGSRIEEKELLNIGDSRKVKVTVKYKKDVTASDLPVDTELLNLSFNITYVQSDEEGIASKSLFAIIRKSSVPDNEASEYVTSSTGIDFAKASSDNNGKGIYMLSSTSNDTNPIYYYRGAVTNNNLKFANFCWKIVRTTENGGIKLIYNGIPDENGYCNNIGEATQIGQSAFNEHVDDNAYVGYMYGTAGSSSYEETHRNTNDSDVKKVIDGWYSKNMNEYTDKLEDTVWCNDRSVISNSEFTGEGMGTKTKKTMYGARNRLRENRTPSLECTNLNDRFTVESVNGNGKLTYPVALLTADEMAYAGASYLIKNDSYYLYTSKFYWSMSPFRFTSDAGGLDMYASGYLDVVSLNNVNGGIRPSVSLKPGTTIRTGDGTVNFPYVID
ncbi:MAG: hypothetical protein J6B89_05215 [Bacilli bacterium]|nr:hypothetical protein [Bacilli bacterium]